MPHIATPIDDFPGENPFRTRDVRGTDVAEYPYAPQPPRYPAPQSELSAALDTVRMPRLWAIINAPPPADPMLE